MSKIGYSSCRVIQLFASYFLLRILFGDRHCDRPWESTHSTINRSWCSWFDKTNVPIVVSWPKKKEKWHSGGNRLEVSSEYRYLGAKLTTKLSYNMLQSDLVHRAKASVTQITGCVRKLQRLSPDYYFKMFDKQTSSVQLHSAELWFRSNLSDRKCTFAMDWKTS